MNYKDLNGNAAKSWFLFYNNWNSLKITRCPHNATKVTINYASVMYTYNIGTKLYITWIICHQNGLYWTLTNCSLHTLLCCMFGVHLQLALYHGASVLLLSLLLIKAVTVEDALSCKLLINYFNSTSLGFFKCVTLMCTTSFLFKYLLCMTSVLPAYIITLLYFLLLQVPHCVLLLTYTVVYIAPQMNMFLIWL